MRNATRVLTDSSAALGIVHRKGSGKLRHIRVGMLWVQDKAKAGEVDYIKVDGSQNPADLMTKHLDNTSIDKHVNLTDQRFEKGHHNITLSVESNLQENGNKHVGIS